MKKFKAGVIVVLVAALGIVILQNREPVQTQFLLFTFTLPGIALLGLTALGGFVAGMLVVLFATSRSGPSQAGPRRE